MTYVHSYDTRSPTRCCVLPTLYQQHNGLADSRQGQAQASKDHKRKLGLLTSHCQ